MWADPPQSSGGSSTDGVAITALVLGILGLLSSVLIIGGVLGLIAAIFGIVGMRRGIQRGIAIGGLVTGVLAMLIAIGVVVLGTLAFGDGGFVDQAFEEGFGEGGFDQGDVFSGELAPTSPCDIDPVSSFDTRAVSGEVTVGQVEVCPDFVDDVMFGVEMTNTGDAEVSGEIVVTASAGGSVVTEPSATSYALAPGESGWLTVTTFDDYAEIDTVDIELSGG